MSNRSVLERMHRRLLTRLGEQAVLRGTEHCQVYVEIGVSVSYEIGEAKFYQSEYAGLVDIANIPEHLNPRPGDALTVGSKTYEIDALAGSNGYLSRCILRGA